MTILCVDDDPQFLRSMASRLRAEGYEVDPVDTSKAAITAFNTNPYRYDVVITDLMLQHGDSGERLAECVMELREQRGYDAAPEIICITGDRRKMQSGLLNSLRDKGCQYVLKGNSDQYVLEVRAALERLQKLRDSGPMFLFVHQGTAKYQWHEKRTASCVPGEIIKQVYWLHSGGRTPVEMGPAPRRVFDFLARHASGRRSFSLDEVTNSLSLSEFYTFLQRNENSDTRDSVKNNILRIRKALDLMFEKMKSNLTGDKVLTTQTYDDHGEHSLTTPSHILSRGPIRVTDISSVEPYSEKDERYHLNARIVVEHIPSS